MIGAARETRGKLHVDLFVVNIAARGGVGPRSLPRSISCTTFSFFEFIIGPGFNLLYLYRFNVTFNHAVMSLYTASRLPYTSMHRCLPCVAQRPIAC